MKRFLLFTFSVLFCSAITAQWSEDFEGNTDSWTFENAWTAATPSSFNSQYFGIIEGSTFAGVNDDALGETGNGSGRLISPMINFDEFGPNTVLTYETVFWNGDYQGADETSKLLYSTDGGATWIELFDDINIEDSQLWRTIGVDISSLAGQGMGQFAWEYSDGSGFNFGLIIDNILAFEPDARSVVLSSVSPVTKYIKPESIAQVTVNVQNNGYEVLESFDIKVTNGSETFTQNVSGQSLGYAAATSFDVELPFSTANDALFDLGIEIMNFNFGPDNDLTDNTGGAFITVFSQGPTRVTVAEEATGTWCPWCPRGAVNMELAEVAFPNDFVAIAVHNSDPMAVTEYDEGLGSLPGFTGYPSVGMNRRGFIDPEGISAAHIASADEIAPASANVIHEWDEATRTVTAWAEIETVVAMGGIRLALVITEDEVTGTTSGYAQANNYAGGAVGVMGGYETLPNPVPAAQMVYQHTARAILGGFNGMQGSLPRTVESGQKYAHKFTYELPADYDENHINLICMLIDEDTDEILTAHKKALTDFSSTPETPEQIENVVLAPNPTNDVTNLRMTLNEPTDVKMDLFNITGTLVDSKLHNNVYGTYDFPIVKGNLEAGTYYVRLMVGDKFITKKVMFVE